MGVNEFGRSCSCFDIPMELCSRETSPPCDLEAQRPALVPAFAKCCGRRLKYGVQRKLRKIVKFERMSLVGFLFWLAMQFVNNFIRSTMSIVLMSLLLVWFVLWVLYDKFQWQREYSEWCTLLNEAEIRWVRVEALRRWSRTGQRIPRMQDLASGDYVDRTCGNVKRDGGRFVVSHAWLAKGDPDPTRVQLDAIVSELNRLGAPDSDVVFYDYASIPQPPRTEDETRLFKIALKGMNLLYTLQGTRVLVIPQVSEKAPNPTPYSVRGWCFFELAISSAFDTVFNYTSPAVVELLAQGNLPVSTATFAADFANKEFTMNGDRDTVRSLYNCLYEQVLSTEQESLSKLYMSFAILQAIVCVSVDLAFLIGA
eukprot:CAMPEP_0194529166 /NCGR_PEP_ID=MMETSP0253-20130528/65777_1 /TAXON_ID=2966 /ORGANISM="Noctiluca scintillans" /LENGTH=368 /DNA_ID=CAMNT_0039374283 /DNA_START=136 /DNA_END=1243 /DNA_ORIENTATION=+